MRLCHEYQIHLIADKVYALSAFHIFRFPDAEPFVSILAIDSRDVIDPAFPPRAVGRVQGLGRERPMRGEPTAGADLSL